MRIELMTLAEIGGLICVIVGPALLWGLGGLITGLGAALLYEARS